MKQVVVISGPSGSGKNALIKKISEKHPNITTLVTATTRTPRPGESDGRDYFFYTQERFDDELMKGEIKGERFVMLYGGIHYGIYLPELRRRLASPNVIFALVDITGARYLKETYQATTIFLMPESVESVKRHIHARSPDLPQVEVDMRLKITTQEMRMHAPQYDYTVPSIDGALEQTAQRVLEILHKEGYHLP